MQTLTEQPPSNLVFQALSYEVEVTAAVTGPFEQAVDRSLLQQALDRRTKPFGVDIYLDRSGACYGRVAKSRTYALNVTAEKASLVANWVQSS